MFSHLRGKSQIVFDASTSYIRGICGIHKQISVLRAQIMQVQSYKFDFLILRNEKKWRFSFIHISIIYQTEERKKTDLIFTLRVSILYNKKYIPCYLGVF